MRLHRFLLISIKNGTSANRFVPLILLFLLIFMYILITNNDVLASQNIVFSDPLPENIARAGVSIVRLLAFYSDDKLPTPSIVQCTGLGVLIRSWTSLGGGDQNNWILTDGNLVNTGNEATCAKTRTTAKLTSIQVFFNSLYNTELVPPIPLAAEGLIIRCRDNPCSSGPVLFAFNTDASHTQPFIDLASIGKVQVMGIALTQNSTSPKLPSTSNNDLQQVQPYLQQLPRFLTPNQLPVSSNTLEPGTPIVNSVGELSALHLTGGTSVAVDDINTFLGKQPELTTSHANPLHYNWNKGISSFYQKDFTNARQAFQAAGDANLQFQAARTFEQLSVPDTTQRPTGTSSSTNNFSVLGFSFPYWMISIVGLLLLLFLLILAGIKIWHPLVLRKQAFKAELEEGERQASIEAPSLPPVGTAQYTLPLPPSPVPILMDKRHAEIDVYCPRCRLPLQKDTAFCPNCRLSIISFQDESSSHGHSLIAPSPTVLSHPESPTSAGSLISESEVIGLKIPVGRDANIEQLRHSEHSEKHYPQGDKAGIHPLSGQRLGNYRLIRLLGHGGFADVYLGEHIFLKTYAAIKVLRTHLTSEALSKFITEARVIASLVHPSIVRVLEFGVEGNEPDFERDIFKAEGSTAFLVMDYAPHGTLRLRHPKGTRVPLSTVISYVNCIAEALYYAHQKRLIHRDIKPENMLLGRQNKIMLSDFGIAAVAHGEHSMITQEMAGTIPYMAPEQIRGRPQLASDQYALGIVVYEWLCGNRPFQGTSWEIIEQHLTTPPTPLREKLPALSLPVEEVILKALAKDPSQRFEDIQAFATALSRVAKRDEREMK